MDKQELLKFIDQAALEGWLELDLSSEDIAELPPDIGRLTQLQSLNLESNRLRTLPWEIDQLTQLECLNLCGNQFRDLPLEIVQLIRLQSLDLGSNRLGTLSWKIGQLTQLRYLNLCGNQLKDLPLEIVQLIHLQELDLSCNQLMALCPQVGQLIQLQALDLSYNQLRTLPAEIGHLTGLRILKLRHNELAALSPEIKRLTNLTRLDLRDNLLPIPSKILTRTDNPADILRAWADYLAGQTRPLNEIKMVLVGEPGVGKTSLVHRLLHGTFEPNESETEGIAIHHWQLPSPPRTSPPPGETEGGIRVNVWDFGGRETMHATHQFSLTHRTLYLLVLDSRYSEAENRLDYWLSLIRSFGGDSPVLVVGNKTDQHPLDLDRRGLLANHPTVQAILATSCATRAGVLALREEIIRQVARLPHVSGPLPNTWFEVKAQLEAADADVLPYHDYTRMCVEQGVNNPDSQRVLLSLLHDLGVVLHFPDPRLETTDILNAEWVTEGIYRILSTRIPFEEQGILTWDVLARILGDDAYREHRWFIVDMMRKFELCYELPHRPHTYLIPDLLPKEECDTGAWDGALAFEVHYSVLPGSILTRLIVRMHRHIHAADRRTVWRSGVLLACEGNEALVKADLAANRITIRVRGLAAGRRKLLNCIREHLGAIRDSLGGVQVAEKVPVPGHPTIPPVDYEWLCELERKGVPEFYPSGLTDPIRVRQLLDGVEPPAARQDGSARGDDTCC
jgi:internalin A